MEQSDKLPLPSYDRIWRKCATRRNKLPWNYDPQCILDYKSYQCWQTLCSWSSDLNDDLLSLHVFMSCRFTRFLFLVLFMYEATHAPELEWSLLTPVSCTHLSGLCLTILAHFMMKLGPKLKQHKSSWNLISQYATLKLKIKTIKKLLPENIKDVLHSQPVLILFFCWQSSVWSLHDMMGWRGCDMISVVSILSNTCQGSDLYV